MTVKDTVSLAGFAGGTRLQVEGRAEGGGGLGEIAGLGPLARLAH